MGAIGDYLRRKKQEIKYGIKPGSVVEKEGGKKEREKWLYPGSYGFHDRSSIPYFRKLDKDGLPTNEIKLVEDFGDLGEFIKCYTPRKWKEHIQEIKKQKKN